MENISSAVAASGAQKHGSAKAHVQKFGGFLAGMVMPNIGAFIAWGLITALFIPTGWLPNPSFNKLVTPMITYLLPLLIGYTGGKIIYGTRGGVAGAIATIGVIIGSPITMFLGAMIMGPLAGYIIKRFDKAIDGKIPAGFEMLVNNFSIGIFSGILALLGFSFVGPFVTTVSDALGAAAQWITNIHMLPLIAILVEPAKVLFLNNAINHGIFDPIGIAQAKAVGKSIFFLLETDPGPGLGVLLAYAFFGKGTAKTSAPGAVLIHFFGGIHEIYFPYILMNPLLLLGVIGGGIAADFTFVVTGAGLVATCSPGSIIAVILMSPKGGLFPILFGIAVGSVVSFLISSVIVKRSAYTEDADQALSDAQSKVSQMKAESKGKAAAATTATVSKMPSLIIFACDAGMGSSAMGETLLRKKLKDAGITEIEVRHSPVNEIPADAEIVFTQQSLAERAASVVPNATIITVNNFLDNKAYDNYIATLPAQQPKDAPVKIPDLIVFACDAGMGSSAMGETLLRKKLKDAGLTGIEVKHAPVNEIPANAEVVFTQQSLVERAAGTVPNATIIPVNNFLDNKTYDAYIVSLKEHMVHA
ncbi:PTS mannitol-specific transporter subunit IIBC [Ethanoligenens harbinense]|uniref:PTS system mannitol-specific EIICB component n=1 Tax=Ethanoligenens harbinense (strain DSM 18485 / JCM 12961 / CGMCC 1.5033 / YUAN-3) TaxID=663278 RepID=E6U8C7_ETHHY|nr:PTS mannitol transporter subunit IICBA [Ethanoligenens harbinense]ADU28246.1 PTS system, mannitol-specific IIC subunit [Ethanoligenens harbinense YUAN-3]AVQ97241.1 PTS mannitol transporter subunit IICB [Ethanoligenens harbinense YUAN-3]AYF39906.1 PTS mannitol transporter subunit IICB [Ethanoligenens harbinense]AYF42736.1 PTS mannitol transporter subunit IICB [Ethanoligenens harbinense]QCN93486.1 PTS mannitol transporter subunit IICBA [Ethanoligenens harbinense]